MGFAAYWRWKSRSPGGRPRIAQEVRDLIRRMSLENPLWGATKIHGELLKLGIAVAQSSRPAESNFRHRRCNSLLSRGSRSVSRKDRTRVLQLCADVFTDAAMSGRTNWEMSPPDWLHPVKGRRFEELNSDLTSRPRLHPTRLRTKSGPDRRDP